jgi:DNA-binding GntR family transcriptional regulator
MNDKQSATNISAIVQPLPLAKLAYERLRQSILEGHMKAGEVYNEMALAEELGVSRTPVREALLELASQGLVTFLPRKGVKVNFLTRSDAEELFEIRRIMECAVAEKVALACSERILRPADREFKLAKKAAEKHDTSAFLSADRNFHNELAKMANNSRIISILGNLRDLIHMLGLEALSQPDRMDEVVAEHELILAGIRAGDAERAKKAMHAHLGATRRAVLQQYKFNDTTQPSSTPQPSIEQ